MFTGLIQGIGKIKKIESFESGRKIAIQWSGFSEREIPDGTSIAIDGACLSVESISGDTAHFIAVEETVNRTTLKFIKAEDSMNVELPITAERFLDGHIVQGHVDCIGTIASLRKTGAQHTLIVNHSKKFSRYVVEKGSIAVNGISLTVMNCKDDSFKCAIIPDTMKRTTLSLKKPGDSVNLEFDIFAKYIEKILKAETKSFESEDDSAAIY